MKYILFLKSLTALLLFSHLASAYYPLMAYYLDGTTGYPIVGIKGGEPVALIDGVEKKVSMSDLYFERGDIYSEGFIRILESSGYTLNATVRTAKTFEVGHDDVIPNRAFIDISFKSDRDLEDCYILLFTGSTSGIQATDLSELFITGKSVGEVEKDCYKKVKLSGFAINELTNQQGARFFVAFFNNGRPVQSNHDENIADHFLQRKAIQHRARLGDYLDEHSGKTKKHESYFTFIPYLTRELYANQGPIHAKATISIDADGTVKDVGLSGIKDGSAKEFLKERISEWLFLPKLEDGEALPSKTATMIDF